METRGVHLKSLSQLSEFAELQILCYNCITLKKVYHMNASSKKVQTIPHNSELPTDLASQNLSLYIMLNGESGSSGCFPGFSRRQVLSAYRIYKAQQANLLSNFTERNYRLYLISLKQYLFMGSRVFEPIVLPLLENCAVKEPCE